MHINSLGYVGYQLANAFGGLAVVLAQATDTGTTPPTILLAFISVSVSCFGALAWSLRDLHRVNEAHAAAYRALAEAVLKMEHRLDQYQQTCAAHTAVLGRLDREGHP